MPNKSYRNAIKEAIELEMRRDPSVIVVGEDVRGGHGGKNTDDNKLEGFGGVLGVTKGLWTEFGSERVIDTPITESAIIGMAAGAAATGLRPVADLMFMDFMACVMTCFITKRRNSAICLEESQSTTRCTRHDWCRFFSSSTAFSITI